MGRVGFPGRGACVGSRRTRAPIHPSAPLRTCVALHRRAGDPRSWIDADEGVTDEGVVALDEPGWRAGLERWFQR